MNEPIGDLSGLSSCLFLFARIDQLNRREEPDALPVMFDRLYAQRRGEVAFARAGPAHQHDIVRIVDERAAMELADQRLIHFAAREVEACQVAIGGEPRDTQLMSVGV